MKFHMRLEFREVIDKIVSDTWTGMSGGIPHEPDYIARLVLKGTPEFHQIISSYSYIWNNVSTVGVFCHQSPMVQYTDGNAVRRCELGDILWCHFHTDINGNIFRNALLFQSKMSDSISLNTAYDDTQLKLYREWPQFEYYRSGALNGQVRNILPKQPHAGAQYMAIDNHNPILPQVGINSAHPIDCFPIGITSIVPELYADTPLESELVRFLFWGSGRPFDSHSDRNNSDEWTKVVWDLLRNGMSRAFNRRRAGFNNSPRIWRGKSQMDGMLAFTGKGADLSSGIGDDFYNEFKGIFSSDNGGIENDNYFPKDENNDGAPSIIIFKTTETKG